MFRRKIIVAVFKEVSLTRVWFHWRQVLFRGQVHLLDERFGSFQILGRLHSSRRYPDSFRVVQIRGSGSAVGSVRPNNGLFKRPLLELGRNDDDVDHGYGENEEGMRALGPGGVWERRQLCEAMACSGSASMKQEAHGSATE